MSWLVRQLFVEECSSINTDFGTQTKVRENQLLTAALWGKADDNTDIEIDKLTQCHCDLKEDRFTSPDFFFLLVVVVSSIPRPRVDIVFSGSAIWTCCGWMATPPSTRHSRRWLLSKKRCIHSARTECMHVIEINSTLPAINICQGTVNNLLLSNLTEQLTKIYLSLKKKSFDWVSFWLLRITVKVQCLISNYKASF